MLSTSLSAMLSASSSSLRRSISLALARPRRTRGCMHSIPFPGEDVASGGSRKLSRSSSSFFFSFKNGERKKMYLSRRLFFFLAGATRVEKKSLKGEQEKALQAVELSGACLLSLQL